MCGTIGVTIVSVIKNVVTVNIVMVSVIAAMIIVKIVFVRKPQS